MVIEKRQVSFEETFQALTANLRYISRTFSEEERAALCL